MTSASARMVVNIAEAYDMATEFPTMWDESRTNAPNTAMGTTSKNVLINQLITDLKSQEHTSTADELDPLGSGSRVLEIMRIKGVNVESLGEDRGTYLPSSTKFNALKFLTEVHGDSSGEELERSLVHLRKSMTQKNTENINIDEDYQQFVTAKEHLDQVFDLISGKTTEGVQVESLRDQIDEAMRSYTLLMRPLEESSTIRDRFQTANNLVKAFKYVLTLPATLQQHIQSAEHDEFIRDWTTGREYMAEFRGASKGADCQKISQIIEAKVEDLVYKYKSSLWKQLMQTPVEKPYARNLEMLADLERTKNPLYEWMSHQVHQIQANLQEFMEHELQNLQNLCRYDRVRGVEANVVGYIRKLGRGGSELDTYDTIEHWMLLQQVFGAFNEHIVKIMAFWKECNLIVAGRKAVGSLRLEAGQEKEIREKFVLIVGEISRSLLLLVENDSSSERGVAYIPMNANTLSTAKYLNQILEILLEVDSEINQPVFSQTLAQVRRRFVLSVCGCWLRDSKMLGQLQVFRKSLASKSLESATEHFSTFHTWVLAEIHKLEPEGQKDLEARMTAVLKTSMESYKMRLVASGGAGSSEQCGLLPASAPADIQVLIIINNLDHIRRESIPQIYKRYQKLFNGGESVQRRALVDAGDDLILELFTLFTSNKRAQLSRIVGEGMRTSGQKWNQSQEPSKVSQHIYEALMLLVEIEADFSIYAANFIRLIFRNLYGHLVECLLRGVREFDQLGQLGTLQLVADTEFLTEVMSTVQGEDTKKVIGELYEAIKGVSGESLFAGAGPATRVAPLVERALEAEKRAFSCFKSVV